MRCTLHNTSAACLLVLAVLAAVMGPTVANFEDYRSLPDWPDRDYPDRDYGGHHRHPRPRPRPHRRPRPYQRHPRPRLSGNDGDCGDDCYTGHRSAMVDPARGGPPESASS